MKKNIVAALMALLGMVVAGCGQVIPPAESQSREDVLTWTLPTTRVDGTALAASEIEGVLIQWGASGGPYNVGSRLVLAPATTVSIQNLTNYGTVCYVAFTKLKTGELSNASNQVCKSVLAPPGAPLNLQVN